MALAPAADASSSCLAQSCFSRTKMSSNGGGDARLLVLAEAANGVLGAAATKEPRQQPGLLSSVQTEAERSATASQSSGNAKTVAAPGDAATALALPLVVVAAATPVLTPVPTVLPASCSLGTPASSQLLVAPHQLQPAACLAAAVAAAHSTGAGGANGMRNMAAGTAAAASRDGTVLAQDARLLSLSSQSSVGLSRGESSLGSLLLRQPSDVSVASSVGRAASVSSRPPPGGGPPVWTQLLSTSRRGKRATPLEAASAAGCASGDLPMVEAVAAPHAKRQHIGVATAGCSGGGGRGAAGSASERGGPAAVDGLSALRALQARLQRLVDDLSDMTDAVATVS